MVFLNSNNDQSLQPAPATAVTAVAKRQHNDIDLATIGRYKNLEQFCRCFSPARIDYLQDNIDRCLESPSLAVALNVFKREGVESLLQAHLSAAIMNLGQEHRISNDDIRRTVQGLCESAEARLLSIVSVIDFFHRLGYGAFDLFESKLTPRRILTAFHKEYFPTAKAREERLRQRLQSELDAKELHTPDAVSYQEYRRLKGIPDCVTTPFDAFLLQFKSAAS